MPKKMKLVPFKKLQEIIPTLDTEEYAALKAEIEEDGCRDAIVVWKHGGQSIIVDGHHRQAICEELGKKYAVVEKKFKTEEDAAEWACKHQEARRNLSKGQKAFMWCGMEATFGVQEKAKEAHKEGTSRGGKGKSFIPGKKTSDPVHTDAYIAEKAGTSVPTASRAKAVYDHGTEEEKKRVQRGEPLKPIAKKVTDRRKKEKRTADAKVAMENMPSVDKRFSLHVCAVADLHEHVKAHSVDCIITDPPYPMEYLECWSELAGFAAHALKPTGSLVAMSGQSYLADIIHRLGVELDYWWTLCYLTPGKKTQAIQRKVNAAWKPLLWYVPRGEKPKVVQLGSDVFVSEAPDKEHHDWGQSESGMLDIVNRMTTPGQTICDPFVGGGATAVAAVSLGRYFVGADSEEIEIGKTKKRLADVKEVK